MLADNLIDSDKPPEGELHPPTVEPDHTHHVLVDEMDPIRCFEYINPSRLFFQLFFLPLLNSSTSCLYLPFHLEAEVLVYGLIQSWNVLDGLALASRHSVGWQTSC